MTERAMPTPAGDMAEKERLERMAIASIEGHNWTDEPLTEREKNAIGMAVAFTYHQIKREAVSSRLMPELTEQQINTAAREVIAEANNSLFGSQNFFLSLNGGPPDKYHLARAIEELKDLSRKLSRLDQSMPLAQDWGSPATELAARILVYLGIGTEASREPGIDRRRDHIAAMIEGALPDQIIPTQEDSE